MVSISKTKAEERLAAVQKSQKAALSEQQEKVLKVKEKTARLRALRLAQEPVEQKAKPVRKRKAK